MIHTSKEQECNVMSVMSETEGQGITSIEPSIHKEHTYFILYTFKYAKSCKLVDFSLS